MYTAHNLCAQNSRTTATLYTFSGGVSSRPYRMAYDDGPPHYLCMHTGEIIYTTKHITAHGARVTAAAPPHFVKKLLLNLKMHTNILR